jgi:YD repeat-containing protein
MGIHYVERKQYLDDEIQSRLQLMSKEWQSERQYNYVYNSGLVVEETCVHKYEERGWDRIDEQRITYQYEDGRLVQMTNHTYDNTYTYYYDSMGNLIREENTDGGWKTYSYQTVFTGDRP